tara:strand:+ start:658 stop:891 length:234 start_codon:yes stop_codon:yes gene_type:complete
MPRKKKEVKKKEEQVPEPEKTKEVNLNDMSSVDVLQQLYKFLNKASQAGVYNIKENYTAQVLCERLMKDLQTVQPAK